MFKHYGDALQARKHRYVQVIVASIVALACLLGMAVKPVTRAFAEGDEVLPNGDSAIAVLATGPDDSSPWRINARARVQRTGDDITEYIDGAVMRSEEGGVWVRIDDPNKPYEGSPYKLQYTFEYTLPQGFVSSERPSVIYQLPEALAKDVAVSGKPINDASGDQVGTYSIDENGLVRLTFTKDTYLNGTSEIKGTFFVEKKAEAVNWKEPIQVNDEVKFEPVIKRKSDLTLTKEALPINADDGTIKWRIKAASKDGTNGEVTIKDFLTDVKLQTSTASVTVKDKNGQPVEATIQESETGFTVNLPEMGPNSEITIEVDTTINDPEASIVKAKNRAEATWTDFENKEHHEEAEAEVNVDRRGISINKSGDYKPGDAGVGWTITIKKGQQHAEGRWTLQDFLNGEPISKDDLVCASEAGCFKITTPKNEELFVESLERYPFDFSNSQGEWKIEYTTKPSETAGKETKNEAKLVPEDGDPDKGISTGPVGGGDTPDYSKVGLDKSHTGDIEIGEDKHGSVNWTIAVNGGDRGLPAGWKLVDDMYQGDKHRMNKADVDAMINSLNTMLSEAGMTGGYTLMVKVDGNYIEPSHLTDSHWVEEFTITFNDPLPAGVSLSFALSSRTFDEVTDNGVTMTNQVKLYLNNTVIKEDRDTVKTKTTEPTITKMDGGWQTKDTAWNWTENAKIRWYVKVHVPSDGETGPLTITDTVPETLRGKLYWSSFKVTGLNDVTLDLEEGNPTDKTYTPNGGRFTVGVQNGSYVINMSSELVKAAKDKDVEWCLEFNLPADMFEGQESIDFDNHASVAWQNRHKDASQKQTVTKPIVITDNALSKEWAGKTGNDGKPVNENNVMKYRLVVNPEGKKLGVGRLTLIDDMKYKAKMWDGATNTWIQVTTLDLVPGSVKVYKPGSTKAEPIADYPYSYEAGIAVPGEGQSLINRLTMSVPDETPLIIEYSYKMNTEEQYNANHPVTLANKATLNGEHEVEHSVENMKNASGATATVKGIQLAKVDAANTGIMLPNAKFELQKFNGNNWETVKEDISTGSDGKVVIVDPAQKDKECGFEHGVAYRLVETEAPNGYVKSTNTYEFMMSGNCSKCEHSKDPLVPKSWNGEIIAQGSMVYFENQKQNTQLQIQKKWVDDEGNTVEPPSHKNLQFKIKRITNKLDVSKPLVRLDSSIVGKWGHEHDQILPSKSIISGSTAQVIVKINDNDKHNFDGVYLNDIKIDFLVDSNPGNWECPNNQCTFTANIGPLNEYANLRAVVPNPQRTVLDIVVTPPVGSASGTIIEDSWKTITLNGAEGWSKSIEVPRTELKDNVLYTYEYEVSEVDSSNLANTNFETEGVFIFENKKGEEEEPGIMLPESGGSGIEAWVLFSGFGTVLAALLGIHLMTRKRE